MNSETEILNAMARYCSQAERCVFDVRKKLQVEKKLEETLPEETIKRIINKLCQEKFIDEKRYSRSFVHDKFRINHWGRIKICYEMKSRGIRPEDYKEAIESIDEDDYLSLLKEIIDKKKRTLKGRPPQDVYQKLFRFASTRGFEPNLITNALKTNNSP